MKIMTAKGYILVISLVLGLAACSDMYQHEKYIEDGERTYTGKVDSVQVRSGKNRVLIEGLLISDPKITGVKISWNAGRDSITVPIERTNRVDTLQTVIEDLEEKVYNFEIVTYDEEGNTSIPVNVSGEVYGGKFQASLLNRPIKNKELYAGNLNTTIEFGSMDLSNGVFATQIRYSDYNGQVHTKVVPVDSSNVKLPDYKIGAEFEYRTMFLPEPASIDTFYTEYEAVTPELVYLRNTGEPFERSSWDGSRWGILADWITNDDVKNANGYGGYELRGGTGVLSLEGGWGLPEVSNGKIYQVVTLPPGEYTFEAYGIETGSAGTKYLAVATGDVLPDVGNIPNDTVAYLELSDSGGTSSIEFQFTENTQVAIGFAGHMPDSGSWFKVHGVAFTKM